MDLSHPPSKRDRKNTDDGKKIELLSAWFCPYAQRTWMSMEIKCPGRYHVTEALVTTSPDGVYAKDSLNRIPLLKESNLSGLVPVIIDRRYDKPVSVRESLICIEYVDELFGDNGTIKLLPGDPYQRADARMWSNRLNDEICTTFYTLLLNQHKVDQDKAAAKILSALLDFCQNCKGPFFYGDEISIVDIVIAPFLVGARMEAVLKHYRNFEVPTTKEYYKYFEWRDSVKKHPSFIATASTDYEAITRLYARYADGTALRELRES